MASTVEKEGKTISEAVINACEELGVSKEEVEIEVIRKDSRGLWGIGSRNAVVRVEIKTGGLSEKAFRAQKTLERILGFLVSGAQSVKTTETESRIMLEIWAVKDKRTLVGKSGETIKALEYLVGRIAARNSDEENSKRVAISIAGSGYGERKKQTNGSRQKRPERGRRRSSAPKPSPSPKQPASSGEPAGAAGPEKVH